MITATHKRRLLKLADFLDSLPPRRFDYSSWTGLDYKPGQDLTAHRCGTTACALGWACAMPAFRRLGAELDEDGSPRLKGRPYAYSEAVSEHLFGLTEDEHNYLFSPCCEPPFDTDGWPDSPPDEATPKQVAKHLRLFVERRASAEKGGSDAR